MGIRPGMSRRNNISSALRTALLMVYITGFAQPTRNPSPLEQLHNTIATIRKLSGSTVGLSNARTAAAERLFDLTGKINPNDVDDKTIVELVSLLDTWDDSVIAPVGTFLENFGARANSAAPKLLEILAELRCRPSFTAGVPKEYFIDSVLKKIGAQSPPALPACSTISDGLWKQWIGQEIQKVLGSQSSTVQGRAAMDLAYLTSLKPARIDADIIVNLIQLLDIPSELVQEGIAMSLGNFGPLAHSAADKLTKLLAVAKCDHARPEYVEAIEKSLAQIAVTPHLGPCGTS